jgi:hypothetical protein
VKFHPLTVTALALVLAGLLAGPAAARSTPGPDAYHNNGWYTGLEQRDLPPASTRTDDYLPWLDPRVIGVAAAAAALLLVAKAVAGRVRHRRVAA